MARDVLCSVRTPLTWALRRAADVHHMVADLETVIATLSSRLLAASAEDVDSVVRAGLEDIRLFFRADRCALMTVSADGLMVRVCHASCGDEVEHVPRGIDLGQVFPWSRRTLVEERLPVHVDRLDDLPPQAAVDCAGYAGMSVRSSLAVPIFLGRRVARLIAIQTVTEERAWSAGHVARLRLLGELLVNALERADAYLARDRERRASVAADSADAGLWVLDLGTNALWMSDRARAIFEFPLREELSLASLESIVDPGDIDRLRRAIAQAATEARFSRVDYRIKLSGGRVRWVSAAGRRELSPNGQSSRLTGLCVDITDRKEQEEASRTNEARLAAGAELAGLGFYEVGENLQVTYADDIAARICGVSPDATGTMVQFWVDHLHEDDRARVVDLYDALNEGRREEVEIEYRYLHPQLGQRWLRHQAKVTARNGEGRPTLKLGVLQDISSKREGEEALRSALDEVARLRDRLETENLYLRQESDQRFGATVVVGHSAAIRRTLELVEQVAPTNATVLITGETGTGKERIATLIHENSPRRGRAMVRVNCSAIPATLVESELFGREKGAYTGALSRQVGRFEMADDSTLFLDEVGDLPPDVQVKLLRVLQEQTLERLGSPRPVKINVRIIAATNRALEEVVRDGQFRSDLYYRLNVFPIEVPPLRQRPEDLPLLVEALVREISVTMGKKFDAVAKPSLEALARHSWPGNVRELRNVLERAMILSRGPTLWVDLPLAAGAPTASAPANNGATLADIEREYILRVLTDTGWRIKGPNSASVRLGLKPSTLYSRFKKLGIVPLHRR